jgi:hypothetical protein
MSVPSSASRPGNGPARPSVSWMSARCSPTSPQEGAGHRLLHRRLLLNLQEGWWRPFSPGGACPGGRSPAPRRSPWAPRSPRPSLTPRARTWIWVDQGLPLVASDAASPTPFEERSINKPWSTRSTRSWPATTNNRSPHPRSRLRPVPDRAATSTGHGGRHGRAAGILAALEDLPDLWQASTTPVTRPSSPSCCSSWLSSWPATLPASANRWKSSSATPPTASSNCTVTLSGSSSCSAATTASPCSARTRQARAYDMTSPLRGPNSTEGGGCAAAHLRARRARYGAAPPAPRVLRIALRATALRAALDPGDHCGPWDQEQRAGPGLPPPCARPANPGGGGRGRAPGTRSSGRD